jgi:hypothetical protein
LAAWVFWLASKLEKILAGTFRCGLGITGSGGAAEVAPVVSGAFCGSDALIWTPSRPFGAGFGIGTVCADDEVTAPDKDAATSSARPARMAAMADCLAIRNFGFLFNASSCPACGYFIVISAKGAIVFP